MSTDYTEKNLARRKHNGAGRAARKAWSHNGAFGNEGHSDLYNAMVADTTGSKR